MFHIQTHLYLTRFCAVPISLQTSQTSSQIVAELLLGVGVVNGRLLRVFSKADVDFRLIPRCGVLLLFRITGGAKRFGDFLEKKFDSIRTLENMFLF